MPTAAIAEPTWLYRDLLMFLGTAKDIQRMLRAEGYEPPPEDTIQGWRNRNSIPGKWAPVVIQLGLARGVLGKVADLKPREKKNDRRSPQGSRQG